MISLAYSSVRELACIACGRVQETTIFSKSISSAHGKNLTRKLDGVMKSTLSCSFDKTILRSMLGFWSLRMGNRMVQTASAVEIQIIQLFNLSALLIRYHSILKCRALLNACSYGALPRQLRLTYLTGLAQRSPCHMRRETLHSSILKYSGLATSLLSVSTCQFSSLRLLNRHIAGMTNDTQ